MAHQSQLITVPYHFSLQSEGSPCQSSWRSYQNLVRKLMEELPEAEHTKALREGNFTSCSLHDILLSFACMPSCDFLIYNFLYRCHRPWGPWSDNTTGWDQNPTTDSKIPGAHPARNLENHCRELPTGVPSWTWGQDPADGDNLSYIFSIIPFMEGTPSLFLIIYSPFYLPVCLTGFERNPDMNLTSRGGHEALPIQLG